MGVSSVFQPKTTPGIASTKMKMFKKVKKRLGLGRVNSGPNPHSNLPPLQFHPVHGENVRLFRDGSVAKRTESFCKGLAFSARPVRLQEKICIKFLEVSTNWSGVLRFGFTSNDPGTLRYNLPKYACPDLTNKPGFWAKALAERLCERDAVLFYYVTAAGDVHFGVNGEEKGVFFSGVDTRGQLWAMLDIYGNSTAVEFVDSNHHLNNSRRHGDDEVDRVITPALANVSLHQQPQVVQQPILAETHPAEVPPLRYQHHGHKFTPTQFHRVRGRNIRLSTDRTVASRLETEFCNGYVFTARPIQLGERLIIQVLNTEPNYMGALTLGLTSCDPSSLEPNRDLPEDPDCLLDRPEYWVLSKELAGCAPQPGDELSFTVTRRGEVVVSKNAGPQVTLMHVDESLTLWAFLDVYGSTQRVRLYTHVHPPPPPPPVQQNVSPPRRGGEQCCPVTVATAPGVGGGTVLVVSLPPPAVRPPPPPHQSQVAVYSPTYIEPVSGAGYTGSGSSTGGNTPAPDLRHWAETLRPGGGSGEGSDCSVCYERQVDSVLYTCGHMCMCYDCSLQQWRGKGGGHCPLCRAVIRDVIRTFKS